jgi:hypothetical protein
MNCLFGAGNPLPSGSDILYDLRWSFYKCTVALRKPVHFINAV